MSEGVDESKRGFLKLFLGLGAVALGTAALPGGTLIPDRMGSVEDDQLPEDVKALVEKLRVTNRDIQDPANSDNLAQLAQQRQQDLIDLINRHPDAARNFIRQDAQNGQARSVLASKQLGDWVEREGQMAGSYSGVLPSSSPRVYDDFIFKPESGGIFTLITNQHPEKSVPLGSKISVRGIIIRNVVLADFGAIQSAPPAHK